MRVLSSAPDQMFAKSHTIWSSDGFFESCVNGHVYCHSHILKSIENEFLDCYTLTDVSGIYKSDPDFS